MLCTDEVDSQGWFRGGRFGRRGGSWFRRGGGSRFRIGGGSRFRRNGGNRFGRNGGQRIWSRIFRFTNQSPQFATSNPNVQPIFQPRITDFTTARPFFVAEPKINFNPPQTVVHPAVIPIPTVAQVHTIRTQLFQMLVSCILLSFPHYYNYMDNVAQCLGLHERWNIVWHRKVSQQELH